MLLAAPTVEPTPPLAPLSPTATALTVEPAPPILAGMVGGGGGPATGAVVVRDAVIGRAVLSGATVLPAPPAPLIPAGMVGGGGPATGAVVVGEAV